MIVAEDAPTPRPAIPVMVADPRDFDDDETPTPEEPEPAPVAWDVLAEGNCDGVDWSRGREFGAALAKAQAMAETVGFDAYNDFSKYWYASPSAIAKEGRRISGPHGRWVRRIRWEVREGPSVTPGYKGPASWAFSLWQVGHVSGQSDRPQWFEHPIMWGPKKPFDKALTGAFSSTSSNSLLARSGRDLTRVSATR